MEQKIKDEIKQQVAETMIEGFQHETGEIVVREGNAVEVREPIKVEINGTIDAAARWLETRHDCITQKACHVLVNRENLSIALQCDENNYYGTIVLGTLAISPEFKRFGINEGKYVTNFEMAELFKMNRTFFENKAIAMKLVSDLQNFKARVDKEIENSNNNRGDRRVLINQAVEHNLPEVFSLILPIFKGTAKQTISVEVYVNPSDLSCTLVSPEANDLIEEMRDGEMNAVIGRIKACCPDIVIIEQ